jgi:hypothetical protein
MNSLSVHKQAMPENPHGTSAEPIPLAIEGADKTESSSDGEPSPNNSHQNVNRHPPFVVR